MLDGILNRGFSSKCKSLMKATRTRIEVVRRRAEAKQRFLKEDLAKLLSNGFEINAYGRVKQTEEFIAGQNLLSCYNFIEQACEYIVQHLSSMQKQRECHEECREPVASLMFAAARFSDLPELRDLRDLFQERYGSALECFVNQKFVEKLSPRPPVMEKRLQLLQDIASEFSIKWDSRGFEQRMVAPSTLAQAYPSKYGLPSAAGTCEILDSSGSDKKFHKYDFSPKETPGVDHNGHRMHKGRESNDYLHARQERSANGNMLLSNKEETTARSHNDIICHGGQEAIIDKHESLVKKRDTLSKTAKSGTSARGKHLDSAGTKYTGQGDGSNDNREILSHGKAKISPSCGVIPEKNEVAPPAYEHVGQQNEVNPRREVQEAELDSLKSYRKTLRPPPYVKSKDNTIPPYVTPKNSKPRSSRSDHAVSHYDGHSMDPSPDNRAKDACATSWTQKEPDNPVHDRQNVGLTGVRSHEKEHYYQDDKIPLPKPRSVRRKQHRSSSYTYNEANHSEDDGAVKRTSSSRRRENSRKGLQILFDDDHHKKDEEERMIDKLLLHYSKKPSTYDIRKLQKKSEAQNSVAIAADTGESSHDQSRDGHDEMVPHPTRSISLPREQTTPSEAKKIFTRANSFQPDSQARHVHPKLPDYDDLAAQFAALKGR